MVGISGRLAKGATWLVAARAVMNLSALASTLVLARLLTPDDFGLVAIATTVFAVIQALLELSLSSALVQHKNPTEGHYHSAFTLNLIRSLLVAGFVAAIAAPVGSFYGDPRLVPIMLVISASTALTGMLNPKLVVFSRSLVFWQEMALGVTNRLVGLVVAVGFAVATGSYWALVLGTIAGQFASLILSYTLVRYRPRFSLMGARELLSFSIWLSLGQAVNMLNWRFDHLAIGYVLGNSTLGLYTVGDRLAALPTREATVPIAQAVFPGFTKLTGDPERLRQGYQRAQSFLMALALPVGCGLAAMAEPLVLLVLGEPWLPAAIVIQFLAAIFAIQTLATTVKPLAMAMGETRSLFYRDLISFLIRIPLLIVGLVAGGLVGVLIARCVSGLIATFINMVLVRRLLHLPIWTQLAVNLRSLLSAAAMVLAIAVASKAIGHSTGLYYLITKVVELSAAGFIAYATVLFALWQISGRPPGPESDIISFTQRLFSTLGEHKLAVD